MVRHITTEIDCPKCDKRCWFTFELDRDERGPFVGELADQGGGPCLQCGFPEADRPDLEEQARQDIDFDGYDDNDPYGGDGPDD